MEPKGVQGECETLEVRAGELLAEGDAEGAREGVRALHALLIEVGDGLPARSIAELPLWYRQCLSSTLQRLALFCQMQSDVQSALHYLDEARQLTPRSSSLLNNIVSCMKALPDTQLPALLDAAKRAVTVVESLEEGEIFKSGSTSERKQHLTFLALAYYHYCTVLEMCLKDQAKRVAQNEATQSEHGSLQSRVHAVTLAYHEAGAHLRSSFQEGDVTQLRAAYQQACTRWSTWLQQSVLTFPTRDTTMLDIWDGQVRCAQAFDDNPVPPPALPYTEMVRRGGREGGSSTAYLAAVMSSKHATPGEGMGERRHTRPMSLSPVGADTLQEYPTPPPGHQVSPTSLNLLPPYEEEASQARAPSTAASPSTSALQQVDISYRSAASPSPERSLSMQSARGRAPSLPNRSPDNAGIAAPPEVLSAATPAPPRRYRPLFAQRSPEHEFM